MFATQCFTLWCALQWVMLGRCVQMGNPEFEKLAFSFFQKIQRQSFRNYIWLSSLCTSFHAEYVSCSVHTVSDIRRYLGRWTLTFICRSTRAIVHCNCTTEYWESCSFSSRAASNLKFRTLFILDRNLHQTKKTRSFVPPYWTFHRSQKTASTVYIIRSLKRKSLSIRRTLYS